MTQYYDGYDWDSDGFPGEYVYGDDIYVDDYYMDERWKPIPGFRGYWVSNKSRVYGPGRYGKGGFLAQTPDKSGHLYVTLTNEFGHRKAFVHKLMASAFIPNPANLPFVRHLDDVSDNNILDNLAWGTPLDNVHDSIRNGTAYCLRIRIPVQAKNLVTGEILSFDSQADAARCLNISPVLIGRVLSKKQNHTNGYTFAYMDECIDDRPQTMQRIRHAKILATNLDTGEKYIFNSQKEAEEKMGIGNQMINRVLKGRRPQTHGYSFEYVFEGDDIDVEIY